MTEPQTPQQPVEEKFGLTDPDMIAWLERTAWVKNAPAKKGS